MIRGTTPTHTFTIPFDVADIKKLKIIYSQDDAQIFCKRIEDCELFGTTIKTNLTQEDTFKFDCKKMVQIQIRVLTINDDLLSTKILTVSVEKCLDDEVML